MCSWMFTFPFLLCKIIISQGPTESGQQFGSSHLYLSQEAGTFGFFKKLNKCYTCIQMPYRLPYECHTLPYIHVFTFFLNIVELECHTQCHTVRMPYHMPYGLEQNAIRMAFYGMAFSWYGIVYGIQGFGGFKTGIYVWHWGFRVNILRFSLLPDEADIYGAEKNHSGPHMPYQDRVQAGLFLFQFEVCRCDRHG